jgi:hypothetical protein
MEIEYESRHAYKARVSAGRKDSPVVTAMGIALYGLLALGGWGIVITAVAIDDDGSPWELMMIGGIIAVPFSLRVWALIREVRGMPQVGKPRGNRGSDGASPSRIKTR